MQLPEFSGSDPLTGRDWYTGPFDLHPCAYFPRELVRWECPRHGQHNGVSQAGCVLCLESKRLEPRRIVFRAATEETSQ